MTAAEVKAALLGRHPATVTRNGHVSLDAWTVLEEFLSIDLLALSAYENPRKGARSEKTASGYRVAIASRPIVGYEVKVSRSDYRRELLRPSKRRFARLRCHEFYFATPKGLLKDDEVAFAEPEWAWPDDFEPIPCRFAYGGADAPPWDAEVGPCYRGRRHRRVLEEGQRHPTSVEERCEGCAGRGYAEPSRVQKVAPTLWVPRDVGLVEIDGRGARVRKPSPVLRRPLPLTDVGALARFVSLRPDARHAAVRASDERRAERERQWRERDRAA